MILVPLFDLKFLSERAAGWYRNFKSAARCYLAMIAQLEQINVARLLVRAGNMDRVVNA
jgi:hypothetical protein